MNLSNRSKFRISPLKLAFLIPFALMLFVMLISGYEPQKAIDFAVAASCLKHSIEHDFNLMSVAEVQSLASGNASGRVQR